MKNLLLLLFILLFGCAGPKTFNKFLKEKIEYELDYQKQHMMLMDGYLKINTDSIPTLQTHSEVKRVDRSFVPALLFWYWNNNLECKISPELAVQEIKSNFLEYSEEIQLRIALNGKTIVLNINNLPLTFYYSYSGHVIILVFAAASSEYFTLSAQSDQYRVSYEIRENDQIILNGKFSMANWDGVTGRAKGNASGNANLQIDNYIIDVRKFTKKLADQIKSDLEKFNNL